MVATGWFAFVLAALKALPALISLISAIKGSAEAAKNQGIGYDKAVKASLETAAARVRMAREVESEAEREHAAKSDDSAFDPEFRR
jgi:hypothetical protein